jgi:hypothetical protein
MKVLNKMHYSATKSTSKTQQNKKLSKNAMKQKANQVKSQKTKVNCTS